MPNPVYRVGDAEVTRIDELDLRVLTPAALYPDGGAAALARHADRFGPGSIEPGTGVLVLSTHAWLVRLPGLTVLIDTATGNDKRRDAPMFDRLHVPFLPRLAAAGVEPGTVDLVLLTHLHADHVGWNTRLSDGDWVPSFPRARHVFSSVEDRYNAALDRGEAPDPEDVAPGLGPMARRPTPGVYADSVRPIVEAGLADRVAVDGGEIAPGLSFLPTPGHSIDHTSILLRSRGEEALFSGDVMHHPLQVHEPGLASCFCEFPEAARRSRLRFLAEAADRAVPVFTSHFAESSAGRGARAGDGYAWRFL